MMLFALFRSGAAAWAKIDARSDLVQSFNGLGARWTVDVNSAPRTSLSVNTGRDALGLARSPSSTQNLSLGADGRLEWKSYRLYWWENGRVLLRDLDLPAPSQAGTPLESVNFGSGPQPLNSYRANGRKILEEVVSCRFELQGNLAMLTLTGNKSRYGQLAPEKFVVVFRALPRN